MEREAKVVEQLRQLRKPVGDIFFYADVSAITGNTCSIKKGDLELTDVRLKATNKDEDGLLIIPKIGSTVIVAANNGDLREIFVCMVDDPEKIVYKHNGMSIDIDGETGKFELKNDQDNLKTIINDLITEITKLTVTTGTGPSGTPINIVQFQQIANRLPKIFK